MENAIEVQDLTKNFSFPVKDSDRGFFGNFFRPTIRSITAVDNISFSIKPGESVAFIGPNGAGKSTTIKMLTGILWPTSGKVRVLGCNPQHDRRRLALKIGTVFGQRSQLLFNLPISDSLDLFAKVYEIPDREYRKQRDALVTLFDIGEILDQPVRKLSLGQRMRAEIAVSLIHKPPIVFLDEPTIGLDIVAKRRLRENLKAINIHLKTTIFLTSHDAGDIESVCARTLIVNHGRVIFDDATSGLKKKYLNQKVVRVVFEGKDKLSVMHADGIDILKNGKGEATLVVDTKLVGIDEALKNILGNKGIEDITIEDPPLEEIIGKIYESH
ncbi:MAG: ATP-binding cassette domain-containing protein [Patescibacteria group bacterium]|nr:ATP-binding cassette domain-containing protein [Patescibacteria group bacterium]